MDMASLVENKANPAIPEITPGDTVKVSAKIVEGGKERIQVFQGVVIKVRKGGVSASFTVRHVSAGIGVERTFPFLSPMVKKVEIVRHGKVRRSRLYYLRDLSGKEARRKIKRVEKRVEKLGEEALAPVAEEPAEVLMAEPEAVAEAPVAEATEAPVAEAPAEEKQPEAVAEAPAEPEAVAEEKQPEAVAEAPAEPEAVAEEKQPEAVAEAPAEPEAVAEEKQPEASAEEKTEEAPAEAPEEEKQS